MIKMAQPWWPLAVVASLTGSFALWYAFNDWERSRYFAIIAGLPVTVFAVVGILKWQQEAKLKI